MKSSQPIERRLQPVRTDGTHVLLLVCIEANSERINTSGSLIFLHSNQQDSGQYLAGTPDSSEFYITNYHHFKSYGNSTSIRPSPVVAGSDTRLREINRESLQLGQFRSMEEVIGGTEDLSNKFKSFRDDKSKVSKVRTAFKNNMRLIQSHCQYDTDCCKSRVCKFLEKPTIEMRLRIP